MSNANYRWLSYVFVAGAGIAIAAAASDALLTTGIAAAVLVACATSLYFAVTGRIRSRWRWVMFIVAAYLGAMAIGLLVLSSVIHGVLFGIVFASMAFAFLTFVRRSA